jgi:hypothetical protein
VAQPLPGDKMAVKPTTLLLALACLPAVTLVVDAVAVGLTPREVATPPQQVASVDRSESYAPTAQTDTAVVEVGFEALAQTPDSIESDTQLDSLTVETSDTVVSVSEGSPAPDSAAIEPKPAANWVLRMSGTPSSRTEHALAFDRARRGAVMFGGASRRGLLGDTWLWNLRGWTQLPLEDGPPPRAEHGLAYHAGSQQGRVTRWSMTMNVSR